MKRKGKQIFVHDDYYKVLKATSAVEGVTLVELTKKMAEDSKKTLEKLKRIR